MALRALRWRLRLLSGLLLALCACHGSSRPHDATAAEASAARDTPGLFLYEVHGRRGSAHLLGTIHVGFGFEEVLTDDARSRFAAAARVITEADVSTSNPEQLMRAALLSPGKSLRAMLDPPIWEALRARLGPDLPEPVLDRLEPWLPTVMLGLEELEHVLAEQKPGADRRLMDVELVKAASAAGKSVAHLETIADQIAIFDTIPMEEQVRELTRSLDRASADQARMLLGAFSRGDEQKLTRALFDEAQLESAPGFYDRVLFQRNARWLPVITEEIERDGAFIAVGAAHLLGERGILHELRRKGYRVTRVGR